MRRTGESSVKVYGLPRTFTNLAAWLVDRNFLRVRAWHHGPDWRENGDPGDKHGPPLELPGMDGYVLCVKSPLAWLASMLRYRPAPLSALVPLWNRRGAQFLAFAERVDSSIIVRYEDVLRDKREALDAISDALGLEPSRAPYIFPPNAMWRGGDNMRGAVTETVFDAAYYRERRYMSAFTGSEIDGVRVALDGAVMRGLRYEIGG